MKLSQRGVTCVIQLLNYFGTQSGPLGERFRVFGTQKTFSAVNLATYKG